VGVIRELITGRFLTDPFALLTTIFFGSQEKFVSLETFYLNCSCIARGEQFYQCEQFEERIRVIWEGILQWVSTKAKTKMPFSKAYFTIVPIHQN